MSGEYLSKEVKRGGIICHLAPLGWIPIGYLITLFLGGRIPLHIPVYIPGLNIFLAWLVWKGKKAQHPFIDRQGRACLAFQLHLMKITVICSVVICFLFSVTCGSLVLSIDQKFLGTANAGELLLLLILSSLFLGFFGVSILMLIPQFIFAVIAANHAYQGRSYQYNSITRW